jgi:hypothetical protein
MGRLRKVQKHHVSIALRIAVLAILITVAFGGHHPPVSAQTIPVLTVEDAVQDQKLAQQDQHLTATDARVQKQWDSINANASAISGMQGEERGIGVALAILQLVSIAVSWSGKRKGGE